MTGLPVPITSYRSMVECCSSSSGRSSGILRSPRSGALALAHHEAGGMSNAFSLFMT